MKRRLLMLLSVFMAITSVGWMQAQKISYYGVGNIDGGTGTDQDPFIMTSLDAVLTAANANTESDSIVINLSDGEYEVLSGASFSITKSGVNIIGTDSNKVIIKSPFDIILSTEGNVSFASLQIAAKTATGRGLVDIKSSNTTVSFKDTKLDIEEAGTGDGGSTACFGIVSQLEVDNNTVNFITSRMYMSKGYQRGLCFRDGAGHTLNMENSKIDGPSGASGYPYVIGIGSWPGATSVTKPVTYNIKNSVVDVNYYAVFTNNQETPAVPVVINIEGSDITAWSALFLRGDLAKAAFPHTVKISDTRLNGRCYNNGPTDGFGTIVLDNCQQMDLVMDSKCRITATHKNIQSSVNTYMAVADVRKKTKGTWTFLPVSGDTCLIQSNNDVYTPTIFVLESETALTIKGIENVKFQSEGGKPCITVYKADGSFRNAATDVTTLLTKVSISDGDKVVFPEGTFTFPQKFVLDKSLTIEGAGKDKTTLIGTVQVTATDGAKVNFNNLHLSATSTAAHAIGVGTDKGSESPDITITDCVIDNADNGVRLMGAGAKLTLKNTDITARYYGVSVRNQRQTVSVDGGTIKGWAAIMTSAGGLTTGDGTMASTGTSIDIKNATLKSATISNEEYGVVVLQEKYNGVVLSIDGSTLEATDDNKGTNEAGVSALSALDIRSYGNKVTVKGSNLSSLYGENYHKLGENILHAAIISLGWHGSDDKSALADNTIEITNSQLNGKTGESLVYSYRDKAEKAYDKLTINGKTYDPASGLICYGEQDLQSKIDHAIAGETILLPVGEYKLSKQLTIKEAITLQGTITDKDSTILIAADDWSGSDGSSKHLVSIQVNKATLKNLVIDGLKSPEGGSGSGINVYTSTGVTLDNVISRNNKAAGLIVNGSTVTATNFRTSGNGWYGVNVDKGATVTIDPAFTIGRGCSFGEQVAIKSDLEDAPASYVVSSEWVKIKRDNATCWINAAASGIDYAIISVPATVVYGSVNLPLISNVNADKLTFSVPADNGIVSIKAKADNVKYDSLQILKPGVVAITMAVGDTTVTQQLEVLKRTITVSGITAKKKIYDGKTTVDLNTDEAQVSGFLGAGNAFSSYTGILASADAGNAVPVKINATFTNSDNKAYYDVSYAAVTDTVLKADLTVQTTKPTDIDFGKAVPAFSAIETGFVNSETNTVLGGQLQFDCPATTTSLAGKYPVMPYGYTSGNYNIKYVADSLEIKAIAPTVELISATVTSADRTQIMAKGRIVSNGGTPTTDLKGGFTAGSVTVSNLKVAKDGAFSANLTGLSNTSIEVKATAVATESLKGESVATAIDLSKLLQNVNFVSELSHLTYGSTAKLSAKDFADGAKVTFTVSEGGVLSKVDSTTIKAVRPGTATITVTAEKEGYITAISKQTVTVERKNLTVTPGTITKVYDESLAATLPAFTLNGLIGEDQVTVDAQSITATFIDKNVGTNKQVTLSGDLILGGAQAANYTLTQPTGLTGSITQGADVKVIVSNVTRKYNEQTLKYDLKFMAGDKDLTSYPYTGIVDVTESNGSYTVSLQNVSFPNYGAVKAEPATGKVDIEKGTPKVLTYNIDKNNVGAQLLDAEGWSDVTVTVVGENDKYYAQASYDNNSKTVRGASLAKQVAPTIDWQLSDVTVTKALRSSLATKASAGETITFGKSKVLSTAEGLTFAVVNTKVLTLTTDAEGRYLVNAVGVGTGAITATDSKGAVAYLSVKVTPAELTVVASGTDKAYDNTTSANVALAIKDVPDGVALDLDGVAFNYVSANVSNNVSIKPSKPITLTGANAANYILKDVESFTGNITSRDLALTSPITKYYDGSKALSLTDYSAEGLIAGEVIPAITVTFEDAAVGINKAVRLSVANGNYKLVESNAVKGNIVKSTLDATLPEGASGVENLKNNVKLVVRETGTVVTRGAIAYEPVVTTEGSGNNTVYYISGGDNDNYTVSYSSNQLGFKSDPVPPTPVSVESVSLDKTALTLEVNGTYTLTATINPSNADDQSVTWASSDVTVATVDADGVVKALKAGKATITVTTTDGNKKATCEVTVTTATGLEEALANTEVFGRKGNIYVNPLQPLQVTVVNMIGKIVYNARISGNTQIPVTKGIYIVKLTNAGNTNVTKVSVY